MNKAQSDAVARLLQNVHAGYGQSFEIDDLVMVTEWSKAHKVNLYIRLDSWMDGRHIHEMLALSFIERKLLRVKIWRCDDGVIMLKDSKQTVFASLEAALAKALPSRLVRLWSWLSGH